MYYGTDASHVLIYAISGTWAHTGSSVVSALATFPGYMIGWLLLRCIGVAARRLQIWACLLLTVSYAASIAVTYLTTSALLLSAVDIFSFTVINVMGMATFVATMSSAPAKAPGTFAGLAVGSGLLGGAVGIAMIELVLPAFGIHTPRESPPRDLWYLISQGTAAGFFALLALVLYRLPARNLVVVARGAGVQRTLGRHGW